MYSKRFTIATISCVAISFFLCVGKCCGKKVALSASISGAVCGQWDEWKETKEKQPSLDVVPADIPIPKCGDFIWDKCQGNEKGCGEVSYRPPEGGKCTAMRVIGGTEADANEFPWDVSIRFIYDWGRFWPEPRKSEDVVSNDFKGLKESHRCTGTLYSTSWVITSAWCALRGLDYMQTKNRFVLWIARGKFLDAKMIEFLPKGKKKGDIIIHPDFNPDPDTEHTKDHDIAMLKVPKPFKFADNVYALQIPPPDMEFEGKAVFTGWGTTKEQLINSMVGRPQMKSGFGTKLFKLELTIVPFEGTCEEIVKSYLQTQKNYNPDADLKAQYQCAKADNPDAQGSCGGDLGGPLICEKDGKKYLCGVKNSWEIVTQCPTPDDLEVFVKPSFYKDWIESTAGKQAPKDLEPVKKKG